MQYIQKRLARLEEYADGVMLGLDVPGADVGGDTRQDLIAGNENLPLGAIERHMLRRMAFADDDAPAVTADGDEIVRSQPLVARRDGVPRACGQPPPAERWG